MVKGKGGNFRDQVVEEALEQGLELHDVKGELDEQEEKELRGQQPLLNTSPVKTLAVQGSKMLAEYVRPHFSRNDDTRYCAMEFSFPLSKDHKGKLPKAVEDAWKFIDKRGFKGVVGIEIDDQMIDVYLASDIKDAEIHLGSVAIEKATVSVVKEIGKGASERVVRFSFQAVMEATKSICTFAVSQFGNSLWIEMSQSQGELNLQ